MPANIESVNGWKGRYGARGGLKATVEALLKAQGATWTLTETLKLLVPRELNLTFETPAARKRWYDNSFTKLLRKLAEAGLVEREHDAAAYSQEMGTGGGSRVRWSHHWQGFRSREWRSARLIPLCVLAGASFHYFGLRQYWA